MDLAMDINKKKMEKSDSNSGGDSNSNNLV